MFCHTGLGHYGHHPDPGEVDLPPETQPTPPSATLVGTTITHLRDSDHHSTGAVAINIYIDILSTFTVALSVPHDRPCIDVVSFFPLCRTRRESYMGGNKTVVGY